MIYFFQFAMAIALIGMFSHGVYALRTSQVYGKGRWYGRVDATTSYWYLTLSYLFFPPIMGYLVSTARWVSR